MQIQLHTSKKKKLGQLIKIQRFVLSELEKLLKEEIKNDVNKAGGDDSDKK